MTMNPLQQAIAGPGEHSAFPMTLVLDGHGDRRASASARVPGGSVLGGGDSARERAAPAKGNRG